MKSKIRPNQLYSAPNHKNSHYKQNKPPFPNTIAKVQNSSKAINYAEIIHEDYDSWFGVKKNLFTNREQKAEQQEARNQLLEQFKLAQLMSFCQKFERALQGKMQEIMEKFVILEYKIARCQNHFNAIEIELNKKSKQINTIMKENDWLRQANKQIERHLEELKKKYEKTREKDKTTGIQLAATKLYQKISKIEEMQEKSEGQRKQVFRQIEKSLEKLKVPKTAQNTQQNIKIILKDLIRTLFDFPQNPNTLSISEYTQQKILQNIQLKFKIAELQFQNKCHNLAP